MQLHRTANAHVVEVILPVPAVQVWLQLPKQRVEFVGLRAGGVDDMEKSVSLCDHV